MATAASIVSDEKPFAARLRAALTSDSLRATITRARSASGLQLLDRRRDQLGVDPPTLEIEADRLVAEPARRHVPGAIGGHARVVDVTEASHRLDGGGAI